MVAYIITDGEEQTVSIGALYDAAQEIANAGLSLKQAETLARAGMSLHCRPRRADTYTSGNKG